MKLTYKLEVIESKPKHIRFSTPLLFVHGAQAGAWTYTHFMDYFSEAGFRCYALSLRGHGMSEGYQDIDQFGLDDYVQDVLSVASIITPKPVLIGHSMGGAIVQRYLKDYQDTIDQAVLLSSAVAGGIHPDSPIGMFFSDSKSFLRVLKQKHPERKITLETLMREVILGPGFLEEDISLIRKKLTKESMRVKQDLMQPYLPRDHEIKIKVHVLGSSFDQIVGLEDILKTADFFKTKPIIFDDLCHFLTLDPNWKIAAEKLRLLLEENVT